MRIFQRFLNILFPPPFTLDYLQKLPHAPLFPHDSIYSLYDYQDARVKKLIYYIKKFSDVFIDEALAEKMYEFLVVDISEKQSFGYFLNPLVLSIPLTPYQQNIRGFNQSATIAQFLAQKLNGTYRNNLIIKTRETKKQALLSNKSERFRNVQRCFSLNPIMSNIMVGQDIIIVDDLVTTGATFFECQKICQKAGARSVLLITIAH